MNNRHKLPGRGEVPSDLSGSNEDARIEPVVLVADQVNDGAASPLPPDHPLAIRHLKARSRIHDLRSGQESIQGGSTDLAVA
jgi:hypothetical protein